MAGQEGQAKDDRGWGLVRFWYMRLRGRAGASARLERWEQEAWNADERQREEGEKRKVAMVVARTGHPPQPEGKDKESPGGLKKLCECLRGEAEKGGDAEPAKEDGKEGEEDSPTADSFGKLALKVAGAVATAVGVTGALVGVGAAVMWIRFSEAHIPAIQAISVQPRLEALAQGGEQTVIFLLIALGALLLIYLSDPDGIVRWTTVLALVLLFSGATLWALLTNLPWWYSGGLTVVALLLALGCAGVGLRTARRFWPMGVAVFVSALVFSSAAAILITADQKFVQSVAVLRGGLTEAMLNGEVEGKEEAERGTPRAEGVAGIYVAATDERIYIAKDVGGEDGPAMAMMDVPRDGLAYAVGPPEPIEAARKRGPKLLADLKTSRNRNVAASAAPAEEPEEGGEDEGEDAATETPAAPEGAPESAPEGE